MSFHIIKGTFHVVGYSPDGDSIRFRANNDFNWNKLTGPRVALNARGHAQLRLEAIDTLETHYRNTQQPPALAARAVDFLLGQLGITGAIWNDLRTKVIQANDESPGFIVSRTVEQNRRPVAFAFAGEPPDVDGSPIFLDVALLRNSANYRSIEAGLAYPTYYKGLFSDLRAALTQATSSARAAGTEIWAEDKTNTGFDVTGIQSIAEEHVILPKLFRRLAEFLEAGGPVTGFKEFLEAKSDGVTIISSAHFTHLDNLIEINGNVVRLTELPENLIFEG